MARGFVYDVFTDTRFGGNRQAVLPGAGFVQPPGETGTPSQGGAGGGGRINGGVRAAIGISNEPDD